MRLGRSSLCYTFCFCLCSFLGAFHLHPEPFLIQEYFTPSSQGLYCTTAWNACSSCWESLEPKSQDESLQDSTGLLEQRDFRIKRAISVSCTSEELILQPLIIHSCGASSSERILGSVTESVRAKLALVHKSLGAWCGSDSLSCKRAHRWEKLTLPSHSLLFRLVWIHACACVQETFFLRGKPPCLPPLSNHFLVFAC